MIFEFEEAKFHGEGIEDIIEYESDLCAGSSRSRTAGYPVISSMDPDRANPK
jgi:hypothetical protein